MREMVRVRERGGEVLGEAGEGVEVVQQIVFRVERVQNVLGGIKVQRVG
jgi:hypothetical protein